MADKGKTSCPHCGEETLAREKVEALDWGQSTRRKVCMLCGGELNIPADNEDIPEMPKKSDALSKLLGGEKIEDKNDLISSGGLANFCKDCRHFVVSPFKRICARHDRETEPMNDCGEFEAK